jgi:hypothetical protein
VKLCTIERRAGEVLKFLVLRRQQRLRSPAAELRSHDGELERIASAETKWECMGIMVYGEFKYPSHSSFLRQLIQAHFVSISEPHPLKKSPER